jgi:hypothetical protein
MLLDPETWTLAQRADRLLAGLGDDLRASCSPETHEAALELTTAPHATAAGAIAELGRLRERLARDAQAIGLATAAAGMHPGEMAEDPRVSPAGRYQLVQQTMRGVAPREPTLALHVHIGVADAESAIRLLNRLRAHLPLLLALSASSPLCRGQATGWPPTARSSFRPSRAPVCRGASRATPTGRAPSTCSCAPGQSPSRPSCGGTCAHSRGSARSRCASWTRNRGWASRGRGRRGPASAAPGRRVADLRRWTRPTRAATPSGS